MTVAPAPIDIHLAAGAKVRDPEGYARFWERVAAEHRSPGLTFCHARQADRSPRYGTLRTDSLQRSLEVVSGELDPSELSWEPTPECAPLWECVTAVRFWWYDHAILVVGLEAEVGTWLGSEAGSPAERLDALQEQIIALTCGATAAIVEQRIRPIVTTARRLDPDGDFLDGPELDGPESQGADDADEWSAIAPRWVARSLVLDRDEPGTDLLARHWLADGGDPAAVEEWVAGELTHVSRWLNYVHAGRRDDTTTVLDPHAAEAWRAMRYAQYFYAALDLVDDRLTSVLAETTAGRSSHELTTLTERLRSLSHRAEMVMLDLQEVRKYVTRAVRSELDRILQIWGFADLVEEPVRFKITICDRRLSELAAGREARARTVTDVILLGIGVTSVLTTTLAVTDFGRSVATDPAQAGYGATTSGLTEWFASQSADGILIGSVVVSALLVVLFLVVRRSSSS